MPELAEEGIQRKEVVNLVSENRPDSEEVKIIEKPMTTPSKKQAKKNKK